MRGIKFLESKKAVEILQILTAIQQRDVRYGIFGGRSFAVEGKKISLNAFLRHPQVNKEIVDRVKQLDASSLEKPDRNFVVKLLHPMWKVIHAVRSFFCGSARERSRLINAVEQKVVPSKPASAPATPPATADASMKERVMSPTQLTRMPTSPIASHSATEVEESGIVLIDKDVQVFQLEQETIKNHRDLIASQMRDLPVGSVKYMLFMVSGGFLLYRYERLQGAYQASEKKGHFFKTEAFTLQVLSEYIERKWNQIVTNEDFIES